jgi:molybdate transport system substrate-binding protein
MKRIAIALGLMMTAMTASSASELKLIAGGSLAPLFKELGPQFEKASGHTLSPHYDSPHNISTRL